MGKGRRAILIAASAFLFLCAGAAGLYIYNEVNYSGAVACVSRQDYMGGIEKLERVFIIFKSRTEWMDYACAGRDMQNRCFDAARERFKSLGDFNDAGSMLREVDYREALYLLSQGDFDQSKAMFAALGGYRDSAQMVFEADYQRAVSRLQNKDFNNAIKGFAELAKDNYRNSTQMVLEAQYQMAMDQFQTKLYALAINNFKKLAGSDYKDSKAMLIESNYQFALELAIKRDYNRAFTIFLDLGTYKDSAICLLDLAEKIYNKGIQYYRAKSYTNAHRDFELIAPYKRSEDYLLLIHAHEDIYKTSTSYSQAVYIYNAIAALGSFEDSKSLLYSYKLWIKYYYY